MNLLQTLPRFTDEVTVSSLPHPISMFMLGITMVLVIFLFIEYRRTKEDSKECKQAIKKLEDDIRKIVAKTDEKLAEVSKKVDSRVDKAVLSLKKAVEQK